MLVRSFFDEHPSISEESRLISESILDVLKTNVEKRGGQIDEHKHDGNEKYSLYISRHKMDRKSRTPGNRRVHPESQRLYWTDGNNRWNRSTVILLFQEDNNGNRVAVVGMKTIESRCKVRRNEFRSSNIGYIQWIDTSGYVQPRERQSVLTRSVVQGYILSLVKHSKAFEIDYIVWFSSGPTVMNKSLCFRDSHQNPLKDPLFGSAVTRWWHRTIDEINHEHLEILAVSAGSMQFHFDVREDDLAVSSIPMFPDDPLTRNLECLCLTKRSQMTCKAFFKVLETRSEYAHGSHFILRISRSSEADQGTMDVDGVQERRAMDNEDLIDEIYRWSFRTREKALKSSKKIEQLVKDVSRADFFMRMEAVPPCEQIVPGQ